MKNKLLSNCSPAIFGRVFAGNPAFLNDYLKRFNLDSNLSSWPQTDINLNIFIATFRN